MCTLLTRMLFLPYAYHEIVFCLFLFVFAFICVFFFIVYLFLFSFLFCASSVSLPGDDVLC